MGKNFCWTINVDRKTAVLFTLDTKGTLLRTFGTFNGPFGSQQTHIGIQKGPIWLSVITKGTRAQLFGPKNQYLINVGPFKAPCGHQQC